MVPVLPSATKNTTVTKAYKPTAQQLKPERHGHQVFSSKIDPGLYPLLTHGQSTSGLNITASDVELYEALGNITDTTNALACFAANDGVPGPEFLKDHGLSHLQNTDHTRQQMMQAALERRIPAHSFVDFDRRMSAYSDLPTYLDAAQASSIPTLSKITDFVRDIRRGEISMDDVMAVGMKPIGTMNRSFGATATRQIFTKLADGTANYTAEQVKTVFSKCAKQSSAHAAMQLLREYGGEYAASVHDFELAHDISLLCGGDDHDDLDAAVMYADRFRQRTFRNHKQIYDLYRAGVDLDFAVEHSHEVDKVSVQQIVAMHEGISKPLTQGWL